MINSKKQEENIILLLRICTFLLAAVSFWSTAQGMIDYTFPRSWQAYAASLGVQGLLLGLNFALPSFLRQCKEDSQKFALYALTVVILFCSSWFSYLYIAEQAYGTSWKTESKLLSQATYREELFKADTYIELYSQNVQNVLAGQVSNLYQQAMDMDQNNVDVSENLNWNEERSKYIVDDFAASDIMSTIISAMENATAGEVTQDVREQAANVLTGMQSNLQSEINNLGTRISEMDTRVASAENSLRNAENRLTNAPAGVDLTPYQNAVSQASRTYENLITGQNDLERQRNDYESALQRTTYYLTILGMAENGVSSYYVGTALREIQRELFQASPDVEQMLKLATDVFDRLQDAVDLGADSLEYQNILSDMNTFIQNLETYSTLKEERVDIQAQTDGLADGSILSLEANINDAVWRKQFNDLKSMISGLPVYTLQGETDSVLTSYDKTDSIKNLDQVIRYYLTEHNAVQKGLIYLISPYREVAVFSLFLALLLDIAAFITGVIIDRVSIHRLDEGQEHFTAPEDNLCSSLLETSEKTWNIIPSLNRYIFLTGDYTFSDGIMTYNAIENGEETEIEYPDPEIKSGFYLWNNKQLCEAEQSLLLFKGASEGPQDGIYTDCTLHYEDQLLTMTQSGNHIFLGPIGACIPVYLLSEDHYDVILSKNISDIHGQKVVISLNMEGNRIVAIYIIE